MHSALVYLFNKGLNDFRSPLEELLVVLRNSKKEGATALGYDLLDMLPSCCNYLSLRRFYVVSHATYTCLSSHPATSYPFFFSLINLLKAYNELYHIIQFYLLAAYCYVSIETFKWSYFIFCCLQLQDASLFEVLLLWPCFSTRYGLNLIMALFNWDVTGYPSV